MKIKTTRRKKNIPLNLVSIQFQFTNNKRKNVAHESIALQCYLYETHITQWANADFSFHVFFSLTLAQAYEIFKREQQLQKESAELK